MTKSALFYEDGSMPSTLLSVVSWLNLIFSIVCFISFYMEFDALIIFPFAVLCLELILKWEVDDALGCSSAAAYSKSVSGVLANVVEEGFTIMLVLLMLAVLVFIQKVDEIACRDQEYRGTRTTMRAHLKDWFRKPYGGRDRPEKWYHRIGPIQYRDATYQMMGELMMKLGFASLVITACLPVKANNCKIDLDQEDGPVRCWESASKSLHLIGFGFGLVVSVFGVHLRMGTFHEIKWRMSKSWRNKRRSSNSWRQKATRKEETWVWREVTQAAYSQDLTNRRFGRWCLFGMWIVLMATVMTFVFMLLHGLYVTAIPEVKAMHMCTLYRNPAACRGEELPSSWTSTNSTEWPCVWRDRVNPQLMPCINPDCDKDDRRSKSRMSIVTEFIAIEFYLITCVFGIAAISLVEKKNCYTGISEIHVDADGDASPDPTETEQLSGVGMSDASGSPTPHELDTKQENAHTEMKDMSTA